MKIGLQVLAYNCADTFQELILPWLKMRVLGYDIDIWVASGQFKEYKKLGYEDKNSDTLKLLNKLYSDGEINHIFTPDPNNLLSDHETRNECISYFKDKDIDVMIQLDADEFYKDIEVFNLLKFIEDNPDYSTYNIVYNNIIGDDDEEDWERFGAAWIKRHGSISHYYFDMHWSYTGEDGNNIEYRTPPSVTVPKELVHPTHYTWTNNKNTTGPSHVSEKIEYQKYIYSGGCGYKWDVEKQKIIKN